jgi:DNA-binding winged helix-turn-helix (wHTH) protein/Tol biopolymer transport system component
MKECKSSVYRFSGVEVREREFSLIKGGVTLTVEPKAFRVLLCLLRSPQKLVRKEQLMNAVWGDAAVTENSLTRCISMLRRVLEDDISEPRYIATVATVGYRFVSRVEVCEDEAEGPDEAVHANSPSKSDLALPYSNGNAAVVPAGSRAHIVPAAIPSAVDPIIRVPATNGENRGFRKPWLYAVAFLALGMTSFVWYLRRPLPMLHVSKYTQITHDGRRKVPLGTDGVRLYLNEYPDPDPPSQVALSGGKAARIPMAIPNPFLADVSADGSTLLVISHTNGTGSIWSVPALGTSLRHLVDGAIVTCAWSPDRQFVIFSTSNGDIDVMRSDGTGAHRMANVPYQSSNFFFERIAWSPDGKTIRFDRNNKIYEMKADGSGLHPFLSGWRGSIAMCCGQWTPNGKFFLFLAFEPSFSTEFEMQPATQIWALDERPGALRSATEAVQLTSGPTRWGRPIPSKDGEKIYAMGASQNGELVLLDRKSHLPKPYLGGISAEGATFSRDGKFVAYVTFPEGVLWKANRDGSNPVQLTDPPLYPTLPRWSPDGKQILFWSEDGTGSARSYVVSSQGGISRPILPEDEANEESPDWSPDGRRIVFDSWKAKEPSFIEIRILDLASGQVSKLPGAEANWEPRWSPDERFIAALCPDSSGVAAFDFETKQWSVVHKGDAGDLAWSWDSKFIYFEGSADDPGVFRIRPTGGQAERIFGLKGFRSTGVFGNWMGLDPDGAPMLLRDVGGIDIYALTLEQN